LVSWVKVRGKNEKETEKKEEQELASYFRGLPTGDQGKKKMSKKNKPPMNLPTTFGGFPGALKVASSSPKVFVLKKKSLH
jgi:hypothetical protein